MSFVPYIYIDYKSLEIKEKVINEVYYKNLSKRDELDDEGKTYTELYDMLNSKTAYVVVEFPELSFIRVHPEFSRYNETFRDVLDELEITYRIEV